MKKTIILLMMICAVCSAHLFAQSESGATKMLIAGHGTVTAVLDSGQSSITDANFSAIFLYRLSEKLFVEGEIEIETGDGVADIGLEHANLVWLIGRNIAFHAGRFVPHFGAYRGKLAEGFMNRFATNPVGFGDGGIGTMEAVGLGFQGGFAAGMSKFNYDLWLSNGPQLDVSAENAGQFDYEAYTDNNKNKALGGRIGFLPFSNSCLELGVSYENTTKTEAQYSLPKSIGVRAMAVDMNFYHKIDFLKSTLRVTGEYKKQDVDKYDYEFPIEGDTTGAVTTMSFNNTANTFYGLASIRPTGSDNKVLRNFELAFRYSRYITPDGAPWAYYNTDGKNVPLTQTAIAINYWLKWNCVAKLCYQKQDGSTNQVFIQLYYGF
ncbi:MAG: hypothetical protein ABI763_04680 [Bacteroidota bacterium]